MPTKGIIRQHRRPTRSFDPDEIKFDEKGKKGKEGEIEQAQLTDEQVTELWMRRIQTSPAQFLKLKFSYQSQMQSTLEN
jgi:Ca-activated chloride channel family protein